MELGLGGAHRHVQQLGDLAVLVALHVVQHEHRARAGGQGLERLTAAGYRAFLIGERFMTDPDPAGAIRDLVSTAQCS